MRFLLRVVIPVDAGNEMVKDPKMAQKLQGILSDIKPEAVYFGAERRQRSFHLIVNIDEASQIPRVTEPFFHAFRADTDLVPIMALEDLQKSAPDIKAVVRKYSSGGCESPG